MWVTGDFEVGASLPWLQKISWREVRGTRANYFLFIRGFSNLTLGSAWRELNWQVGKQRCHAIVKNRPSGGAVQQRRNALFSMWRRQGCPVWWSRRSWNSAGTSASPYVGPICSAPSSSTQKWPKFGLSTISHSFSFLGFKAFFFFAPLTAFTRHNLFSRTWSSVWICRL